MLCCVSSIVEKNEASKRKVAVLLAVAVVGCVWVGLVATVGLSDSATPVAWRCGTICTVVTQRLIAIPSTCAAQGEAMERGAVRKSAIGAFIQRASVISSGWVMGTVCSLGPRLSDCATSSAA